MSLGPRGWVWNGAGGSKHTQLEVSLSSSSKVRKMQKPQGKARSANAAEAT